MTELKLKNLIKLIREKSTLIIFLLGFVIVMMIAFNLFLSTLVEQKTTGKITNEAASTQVGFDSYDFSITEISKSDIVLGDKIYNKPDYIVKSGDSLWKIAMENYSDPLVWPEIYELNKQVIGDDPNLIFPLTELKLPVIKSRL